MSNNLRRIVTALVAAPAVLGLAYLGDWWFAGLVAGIGVLGQWELYRMARQGGAWPQRPWGFLMGALGVASILRPSLWPVGVAVLLVFIVTAPLLVPQEHFLFSFTATVAGIVYPTGLLGSFVWLREARSAAVGEGEAFRLVVFVLVLVWATDVAAYYVGKTIGQRPLAPSISPNKTWAGTLGGGGAALIVGVVLKLTIADLLAWAHVAALIGIGGGVSQLGDLLESKLKRSVAVDDSSQLLPGHGGMLDRFDAMAVAAPLSVLYLHLVAGLI